MITATRYYIRFVCSNGRVRYCGQGTSMPYVAGAAAMYETFDACHRRIDLIPATHRMKGVYPEIMSRRVLVPNPVPIRFLPGRGPTIPTTAAQI